jgi:heptosyltransferase-2
MSKPKKILVIRLKQIGDALLCLPVCNSLRATYPESQIDYLVYQHIKPILQGVDSIDNLITISPDERSNKWKYWQKAHWLRRQNYDLVIDLINVPVSSLMTAYCGAPLTIGFDKKRWRSRLYKTTVAHRHRGDTVSKKLDILKGLPDPAVILRDWQISFAQADKERIKKTLESQGVDFDKLVVFVAASSRRADKLWPQDYMVETLNHLCKTYNAQIVFNWVPGVEGELVAAVASKMQRRQGVFTDIDIKLNDLPIAISLCDLFFGNDGGPNHMAIGTGVPSLAIFAPFHRKEAWLPIDEPLHQGVDITDAMNLDHASVSAIENNIKRQPAKYYAKITPALVIQKLDEMMAKVLSK